MKATLFTAGLALTAALSATTSFAGAADPDPAYSNNRSTLTREAVRAEYIAAKENDTLPFIGEGSELTPPSTTSTLTREAVRAEYIAAKENDTLPFIGEGSELTPPSTNSTLTREAVRAEYFAAKKNGTLPFIGEGSDLNPPGNQ